MSGVTILNVKGAFLPTVYEHQNIIMPILIILAVASLVGILLFVKHEIVSYIFFWCFYIVCAICAYFCVCASNSI